MRWLALAPLLVAALAGAALPHQAQERLRNRWHEMHRKRSAPTAPRPAADDAIRAAASAAADVLRAGGRKGPNWQRQRASADADVAKRWARRMKKMTADATRRADDLRKAAAPPESAGETKEAKLKETMDLLNDVRHQNFSTVNGNNEALHELDEIGALFFFGGAAGQLPGGLMGAINGLRCQVCWARPDVYGHPKCFTFLKEVCKKNRDQCPDVCDKFENHCEEECKAPSKDDTIEPACDTLEYLTGETTTTTIAPPAPAPATTTAPPAPAPATTIAPPAPAPATTVAPPAPAPAKEADSDGDGVPDSKDAYPHDPTRWEKEAPAPAPAPAKEVDSDGDGVPDSKDAYPNDPKRWEKDSDGDGVPDSKDAYPNDPKRWEKDSDGDGYPDSKDAYPNDPNRWEKDSDGDGYPDSKDAYPNDPERWEKDSDGDGVPDSKDAYPNDPTRWKKEGADSDGDGVPDAKDAYPNDPTRWVKKDGSGGFDDKMSPASLNKVDKPLPAQGYDEHSPEGEGVQHDDGNTFSGDWRKEWPHKYDGHSKEETEAESILRACKENPKNTWCERYKVHGNFAR